MGGHRVPDHIIDKGKTFSCKHTDLNCICFARCNKAMNPNSGVYRIQIRINTLDQRGYNSPIGITTIGRVSKKADNTKVIYPNSLFWVSCQESKDRLKWMNYRLLGTKKKDNVFSKCIRYKSNNDYYGNELPNIVAKDILIVEYDSNCGTLSFKKQNDNKLDAMVTNLPRNKSFYWIATQQLGHVSVTILDF